MNNDDNKFFQMMNTPIGIILGQNKDKIREIHALSWEERSKKAKQRGAKLIDNHIIIVNPVET